MCGEVLSQGFHRLEGLGELPGRGRQLQHNAFLNYLFHTVHLLCQGPAALHTILISPVILFMSKEISSHGSFPETALLAHASYA